MNALTKIQLTLFSLILLFAATTGNAWALTAANTQIVNNASLTYNDGTGTKIINATPVVVTVSLIPSAPNVTPGGPQSTSYAGAGTTLTNSFAVTATSNGPDTYNVTLPPFTSTNTSGATATVQPASTSITLGATVTLAGNSTTVLNVPYDGQADSKVNGITAGSSVVVGAEIPHTVQSVSENAVTGISTITLTTALSASPTAGVLVAERKSVLVDVTAGNITTSGTSITVSKDITVTSTTAPNPTVTSGTVTDTFTSGTATLNKYVRNVTAVPTMTGTGTKYTYNSIDYWPSGITAKPGEVLEYILVANNSGTGSVLAAAITDALPTTFVSLKTGAYSGGTDITYFNESNGASYLTAASGDDAAKYEAPNLTVNVGTGATSAAGGTIAAGATVRVLYRVTVNP